MEQKEQLARPVMPVGNGAHVFVPKEWLGETVQLTRLPRPPVKERAFALLQPYLPDVIGAYIFGSQARGEAGQDSDIDLLVISSKKFVIRQKGVQAIVLPESSLDGAFRSQPLMLCAALAEAKPIINAALLEQLREKYRPERALFRSFLEDTKKAIETGRELLNGEGPRVSDTAVSYSVILRLRGIYIMSCLLGGKTYTLKEFLGWLSRKATLTDVKSIYLAYEAVKSGKKRKHKLRTADLKSMLSLLEMEVMKEETRYGKPKKTAPKRN